MSVRVLLADDHQLIREALRSFLEKDATIQVVAETGDGLGVVALARQTHPDVVCMDINMPGMNGIECVRRLKPQMLDTQFLMLTVYDDSDHIFKALSSGATGYMLKRTPRSELLDAVKRVPAKFGLDPIRDIQVLSPMNRGSLGVRELNVKLQAELNPATPEEPVVEKFG